MESKHIFIRNVLRVMLLLFAFGFYHLTVNERWIPALICLVAACLMWLMSRYLGRQKPVGIGRSVYEDDKMKRERAKKAK